MVSNASTAESAAAAAAAAAGDANSGRGGGAHRADGLGLCHLAGGVEGDDDVAALEDGAGADGDGLLRQGQGGEARGRQAGRAVSKLVSKVHRELREGESWIEAAAG